MENKSILSENQTDDFSLELTLKPIIRSLLRWLKPIYLLGYLFNFLLLLFFIISILFKGILENFVGDKSEFYNYLKSPFTLVSLVFIFAISKNAQQFYKSLKQYSISNHKSDLVDTFYQLKQFFRFLFFTVVYVLAFLFIKFGVDFIWIN
ncbi:hypothetical protein [Pedobacter alpinus]|uniref:Uncharacterized protein n=1 Tax=Pedobacter alpinus TaxID=1590643 RepID=A0ABW5TT22_9SPHI